jgi:hypothetical protein
VDAAVARYDADPATVREIARGGHQLHNDRTMVAKEIISLG